MDKIVQYAELVPRGVYYVGDQLFLNKTQALLCADKSGTHPTWDFHNDIFSKFNWQQEPDQSLDYFYKFRCEQIRDKYDHIVLHFSGGSDSHNILTYFWLNNIHIDEILVAVPVTYYEKYTVASLSDAAEDLHNEWFNVIKPDLKWIKEHLPKTKITLYDYTKDMLNFNLDQDWIHHAGEHFNPNLVNRVYRYNSIDQNVYDKKNVGHIYGIDKPRVFTHDDVWYFAFLDSTLSIQSSWKPIYEKHTHINVENFYWSTDLPQLLIKQAHLVKKFFESNTHLVGLATFKNCSQTDRHLYQDTVRNIIYPHWRRTIFQNKKSNNSFFKEFDQWFFNMATDSAKSRWMEGFDFVTRSVSSKWFNFDNNGRPSGFVGLWAKWHKLS